jgi:hypothetical protein
MNTKSLLTTKAILTIAAIASVAVFANFALSQHSEAAITFVRGETYPTAEGVEAIAYFRFVDGEETIRFPVFTQTNSLLNIRDPRPSFDLEGVVGEYPLLHTAVDEAKKYGASVDYGFNFDYKFFDVEITLEQAGEKLRAFKYDDCRVLKYSIDTQLDKEEGYFTEGKKTGFAILDKFSFECEGYAPVNPSLAKMNKNNHEYSTQSTMAYELKQAELQKRLDEFQIGSRTKGQ